MRSLRRALGRQVPDTPLGINLGCILCWGSRLLHFEGSLVIYKLSIRIESSLVDG